MNLAWGLGAESQGCFLGAQALAWGAAQAVGGQAGGVRRPLAASLRTCWSCSDPPRALPAMKRRDIFHHRQEDERGPPLLEAFWGEGV